MYLQGKTWHIKGLVMSVISSTPWESSNISFIDKGAYCTSIYKTDSSQDSVHKLQFAKHRCSKVTLTQHVQEVVSIRTEQKDKIDCYNLETQKRDLVLLGPRHLGRETSWLVWVSQEEHDAVGCVNMQKTTDPTSDSTRANFRFLGEEVTLLE